MRIRLLLAALALIAAACDTGQVVAAEPTTTAFEAAEPAASVPVRPGGPVDPDAREASRDPAPVSETILIPAPAPAPEPTKPLRSGLPTPPPPRTGPTDPALPSGGAIEAAVADLASRLGVSEATIDVLDARTVTWRDGSVGCPEPGLAYTQAEVPGALIVLRSGSVSYRYHAADGGPLFFCENPQAPLEGGA